MSRGIDYWILSAEQWKAHWNELMAISRIVFGNTLRLPCNIICTGIQRRHEGDQYFSGQRYRFIPDIHF